MATFMNYVINYSRLVDSFVDSLIGDKLVFDKVYIALVVTKIWARAGLLATKSLEKFFMLILAMPDKWLEIPGNLVSQVSTTSEQKIKILSAHTDVGDITNKLKLFLRFYWEKGGDSSSSRLNGFDFMELRKLLNCSMLYCCYLLTDKQGNIKPEDFWNSVNKFLVECTDPDVICYISKTPDKSDRKKLLQRHVDFDNTSEQNTDFTSDVLKMLASLTSAS